MILQHYYDLIKSFMLNTRISIPTRNGMNTTYTPGNLNFNDVIFESVINLRKAFKDCSSVNSTSSTSTTIRLGSNNTPATEQDGWLKKPLTSSISATVTKTTDVDNVITKYITVTNIGDTDSITIGEIGLSTSSVYIDYSTCVDVLIDRTTLAEPIILAPGQSGQIEYSMNFNQEV